MNPCPASFSRRDFLRAAGAAAAVGCASPSLFAAPASLPAAGDGFSFVLLGDLHYDKLEHHDFEWLAKNHPKDRSQIENYSKLTRDVMPGLFATLRSVIDQTNRGPGPRIGFVLHVGDLVEGLCGSEERAVRQNTEALAFVRDAKLGVPFLFAKGNHDVTGDGARAAFASVFHPFLTEQLRLVSPGAAEQKNARYTIDVGRAQIAVFDAYDPQSLEWFEAVAARRTAEHFFLLVHPPVVPYGARATWHLYSGGNEKSRREKLLSLLGNQRALVLGGHIHRYNSLVRTGGRGRFAQLAVSSVISTPRPAPQTVLTGVDAYNADQISVEPGFSPETKEQRRAVYEAEKPAVTAFEYADLPGYAIITVKGPSVTAEVFTGTTRERWRTLELSRMAGSV